jgi:hypothetical protein
MAVPVFQEVRLSARVSAPTAWNAEVGLPDGTTLRLAELARDPKIQTLVFIHATYIVLGADFSGQSCELPDGTLPWGGRQNANVHGFNFY